MPNIFRHTTYWHLAYCYFFFFQIPVTYSFCLFFFNDTATTEIYTLSLHDALPISRWHRPLRERATPVREPRPAAARSEEHTSELQSRENLVCRLLLEKKKTTHQRLLERHTRQHRRRAYT